MYTSPPFTLVIVAQMFPLAPKPLQPELHAPTKISRSTHDVNRISATRMKI